MLINRSEEGTIKFEPLKGEWNHSGMVTDALWTDFDDDGWVDLFIVGEFMPLTLFKNHRGTLRPWNQSNLSKTNGWWNSITAGDFDRDGDTDYIMGNLGLNSRYRATIDEPLCIYNKDFDNNGTIDAIISRYIKGENYITHSRDDLVKQIRNMQSRFTTYESYATANFSESFLKEELEDALVLKSVVFEHTYLENKGSGTFAIRRLPIETQQAPIYGALAQDFDSDGFLDVLMTGNSYATEASTGRYDALNGLYLKGDGRGNFESIDASASGFHQPNDAKGLATLNVSGAKYILSATNNDSLRVFVNQRNASLQIKPMPLDTYALIKDSKGNVSKHEFYNGNGYLSSSSRILDIPLHNAIDTIDVQIINSKGMVRKWRNSLK